MFVNPHEPRLVGDKLRYVSGEIPIIGQLPHLDVRGFALESALLVEAKHSLRPCSNNRECRGVLDYNLLTSMDRPVVLAASMSLNQLLVRSGKKTPEEAVKFLLSAPRLCASYTGLCVLCHRHQQTRTVIDARKTLLMNHQRSPIDSMVDDTLIRRIKPIQHFVCPVDTIDGYRSEWCLKPQQYDPYFYPLVDPPMMIYKAITEGGLIKILQTALAYDPVPLVHPAPGDLICKFIARIANTDGYDHNKHASMKKERVSLLTLNFFNLRDSWAEDWRRWSLNVNDTPIINELGKVNKDQLKYIVDHPTDNDYHLHACRLWDSYAFSDTPDFSRITSSATFLPQWHNTVNNLSYWTSLSKVDDAILHQLSKSALKQRCQTRNSKDMITKRMISRTLTDNNVFVYNANLFMMCKDLLLCALLGNYRGRERPLTANERHEIIVFFESGTSRRWIMNLFVHCPNVLNICIRDFVGDQWRHRPALSSVIRDVVFPAEYVQSNCRSVSDIRQIIMEHRHAEWNALPTKECSFARMWLCGSKNCTIPCKHTLLMPNKLRSLRQKKHTVDEQLEQAFEIMDPKIDADAQWTRPSEFQSIQEDQFNETEAGWTWTPTEMHHRLNKISDIDKNGYRRPYLMTREIFRSSRDIAYPHMDLFSYTPRHLNCLNVALVDLVDDSNALELFHDFKTRKINLLKAKQEWKTLKKDTQELIRKIDYNIQQHVKRPQILELSHDLAKTQLDVINTYHMRPDGKSMVGALHYCVVYCRTCNTIKTSVDCHQHGLRGIKISFVTMSIYCSTCDGHLTWHNILGKIFIINHIPHCLCTKCGFLVSNPIMRENLICASCTSVKRPPIEAQWRKTAKQSECAVLHCNRNKANAPPGKSCLTDASAHYIADGVFMCSRHYDDRVLAIVDSPDLVTEINKLFKKRKRNQIKAVVDSVFNKRQKHSK